MGKNLTYILLILLITVSSKMMAQSEFKALEDHTDIHSISINRKMFEMITNVKMDLSNPADKAYYELVKKIDLLKVLSTTNLEKGKNILEVTDLIIKNKSLKKINPSNSPFEKSDIYISEQDNTSHITQLLMITQKKESNEVLVMYLSGTFSLDELPSLTEKMNIPLQ